MKPPAGFCLCRFPLDQLGGQGDLLGQEGGAVDAVDEQVCGDDADLLHGHPEGGQGRRGETGGVDIGHAHHRHIPGDGDAALGHGVHGGQGHQVAAHEKCGGQVILSAHLAQLFGADLLVPFAVDDPPGVDGQPGGLHGQEISLIPQALADVPGLAAAADVADTAVALGDQMLRGLDGHPEVVVGHIVDVVPPCVDAHDVGHLAANVIIDILVQRLHILLEKPISPDPVECLQIQKTAHEYGRKIVVCHVLRYTNFFAAIKQILESGELGKIVTIQHAENVGNFHMAHSFVRGNWRNSALSSPIIMQKSCHDMDILVWLTDSEAKTVSSFGRRTFFREENAPEGSAARCLDCALAEECRFDVRKAYLTQMGDWPATVVTGDQTEEGLMKAFETSPYGRCVFRCDNDVCDHQVTIIEFKNGVTATFHLSGLTNKMHRTIRIMCEHGEISGDDHDNTLIVTHYSANANYEGAQRTMQVESLHGFHGGGDLGLTMDFLDGLQNTEQSSRSSIDRSIESHIMAYAAERSRVTGQTVDMDELKAELLK